VLLVVCGQGRTCRRHIGNVRIEWRLFHVSPAGASYSNFSRRVAKF
jgi:hypothetical protein